MPRPWIDWIDDIQVGPVHNRGPELDHLSPSSVLRHQLHEYTSLPGPYLYTTYSVSVSLSSHFPPKPNPTIE